MHNKNLRILLILTGVFSFSAMFSSQLVWFPLLKQFGFQDAWFGFLFSAMFVFGIFLPHFTKPLVNKVGSYKKYFIILLIIVTIPLFFVKFIYGIVGLLTLYLFTNLMFDFYTPVRDTFLQKFVPSKQRATIGSLRGMILALAIMISSPLAGFSADKLGFQNTIILGALLTIPVIILYTKIKEPKTI
jgi:MFS family permease